MRIGILTFHNADNFGCALQCFALQESVKELCPNAEVEIINFHRDYKPQSSLSFKDEEQAIRAQKFNSFREKYLNIYGEPTGNPDELDPYRYDLCIVGSDQVWNYNLVSEKEKAYFLSFASAKTRKISYAASLGSVVDDESKTEWLSKWIKSLDSVSLREKSAYETVRVMTEKSVTVCIDPTLLHDKLFWEKYERVPASIGNEPYIFMYALGYNWCREYEKRAAEMASDLAKAKGIRVIHYYYGKLKEWFPDGSEHCFCEGPLELLWLFHHADSVVCCSFHGTAFSIIFEKPFYTFHTPGNGSRMKDLVDSLMIPERYIEEKVSADQVDYDIPWKDVNARLAELRNSSLAYLKKEIEAAGKNR